MVNVKFVVVKIVLITENAFFVAVTIALRGDAINAVAKFVSPMEDAKSVAVLIALKTANAVNV
jgi:hypothetical protein